MLEDTVIHADETTVQVLKENGKAAASASRMWVYASWEGSKKPIRIFEYQPDRSGKRPANFLKGFTGYLVTDGYAGYNQVANVPTVAAGPTPEENGGKLCRTEQL